MVSGLGVGLAVIAACCLGGQALTIRLASQAGRTLDILLTVMLINALVFVPLVLIIEPAPLVTVRGILAFAGAGLVGTLLGRAFFYAGIKRIGASRAEPIKASMPLHAAVLAVIVLGEPMTIGQFAGVVLIVVGIAAISFEGASTNRLSDEPLPWAGFLLPLAAAFFFGLEPIFASVGFAEGMSVIAGLTIKSVVPLILFSGFLLVRGQFPRYREIPWESARWYCLAGVASVGFLLAYYSGLHVSRVGIIVPIMQTSPLLVAAVSAIYLQDIERVTFRLLAASGIVVVGAILIVLLG